MPQLDVSSLKPIGQAAPQNEGAGLDISSLKPVNGNSPPPPAPEPTSSIGDVAAQAGYGLISGVPHAITGTIDMAASAVLPTEATRNDDSASTAIKTDKAMQDYLTQTYGPADPKKPNGWTDDQRRVAYLAVVANGAAPQPKIPSPTIGQGIEKGLSAIHANPDDYLPAPKTAVERVARAGGEGAILMAVPGLGEVRVPRLIADAMVGAVSSGGGKTAEEIAPDWLKPYANVVVSMLLGGAGAAGIETAKAGAKAAIDNGIRPVAAGMGNQGAREGIAGRILSDAAEDPQAAIKSIENLDEVVPGSKPTTFQATGDTGLGTLSGVIERENPAPFIERYGQQNAARVKALTDVQAEGHPEAVADYLRAQLGDLDARTQAAQDRASMALRDAQERAGGTEAPSVYGDRIRQSLQDAKDAASREEDQLWEAVDPNKDATVLATPIKRANETIYGNMSPEEKVGLTSNEKALSDIIGTYGATLPLDRLIRLRSRVSTDMRAAQSPMTPNSEAYGRLTQLRGAIEDAISDSIAGRVAQEQKAVQTGAMSADDTLAANLNRQLEAWRAQRNAKTAGADSSSGAGPTARAGTPSGAGVSGTVRETGVGPSGNASVESVPSQSAGPTLDADAAARLRTATAATQELKTTFGAKPVAQIMKRPGATYPYTMQDGQVAETAFQSGAKGADSVRSILGAAKNAPETVAALTDAAAASLRAKGDLTAAKLDAWRTQHAAALDEIERVAPGTKAMFDDIGRATEHIERVAQVRKDAVDDFQRGKIGQIMGVTDPADVTKTIGGILGAKDAVKQIDRLVAEVGNDPVAMEGLRKALVDTIMAKAQSTVEAGASGIEKLKPDTFIRYLNQNETALGKVFSPDEIKSMRAVALDLKRANRSVQTTPGSATAQWRSAAENFGSHAPHDMFGMLWQALRAPAAVGAATMLGTANPIIAGAASISSFALGHLRRAGIDNAQDLVRQAMLDPALARVLLMKAPKRADAGAMQSLVRRLAKLSIVTGLSMTNDKRETQARAGS